MQPIDYSKWDHIDCSSDESIDENSNDDDNDDYFDSSHNTEEETTKDVKESSSVSETSKRHPNVTKLEYPSKVIIGPDGVHMERMPETATSSPFTVNHVETHHNGASKTEHKELLATEQHEILENETKERQLELTENTEVDVEDEVLYFNLIKNGGREGDSHLWSQTSDTVTVSFIVPFTTKSKNVCGFRITDNYSAETYQTKSMIDFVLQLQEPGNGENVITPYHHTFRYPIKLDEDLIDGCWQLQTIPSRQLRLLVVQVFKREVGVGMTLWWDKCFEEDTESIIDPCQIEERKCRGSNSSSGTFHETWQKAHEEFKKRMKERKPNQVELENEEYENEGKT